MSRISAVLFLAVFILITSCSKEESGTKPTSDVAAVVAETPNKEVTKPEEEKVVDLAIVNEVDSLIHSLLKLEEEMPAIKSSCSKFGELSMQISLLKRKIVGRTPNLYVERISNCPADETLESELSWRRKIPSILNDLKNIKAQAQAGDLKIVDVNGPRGADSVIGEVYLRSLEIADLRNLVKRYYDYSFDQNKNEADINYRLGEFSLNLKDAIERNKEGLNIPNVLSRVQVILDKLDEIERFSKDGRPGILKSVEVLNEIIAELALITKELNTQ